MHFNLISTIILATISSVAAAPAYEVAAAPPHDVAKRYVFDWIFMPFEGQVFRPGYRIDIAWVPQYEGDVIPITIRVLDGLASFYKPPDEPFSHIISRDCKYASGICSWRIPGSLGYLSKWGTYKINMFYTNNPQKYSYGPEFRIDGLV